MKISELLLKIESIASSGGLSTPYVVGGLPRDLIFNSPEKIKDIDITTGDNTVFDLAILCHYEWPESNFKGYDDGHFSLDFYNIKIDFSNNYKIPNIENILMNEVGLKYVNELIMEVYSRDFTINTLLQPANLNEPAIDITGKAYFDIRTRVLRTPINPEYTIGYDPRRILRALKLAIKFNLKIEDDLKNTILNHRGKISSLPTNQVKKQINEMLRIDTKKTLNLLKEMKLLPLLPLSKLMMGEIIENNMIQDLIDGQIE